MNQNRKEELLTRWMDGVLTDAEQVELAPYLAAHPELEAEREGIQRMRGEIRRVIPASEDPPYPDFFNAHLERLISEDRGAVVEEPRPANGLWRMLSLWLAPAAAAAVVLAFLAGMQLGHARDGGGPAVADAMAPAVYSPIATVQAAALQDESFGGTVIVLEGLDAIPNSVDLFQTAEQSAASELYMISTGGETF